MAKKTKRKSSNRKHNYKGFSPQKERGFDFGFQMRTMAVPDFEFNQSLRDAGVIGCAYGYHPIKGISHPIPSITLIGTNVTGFERAYQSFKAWGCEEDGDVLDVELLLKSDGSYNLWLGPEKHRLLYRTIPQSPLFEVLVMGCSYVKTLDSTHEMVRQLKRYCESKIHPVIISAAIGNPNNPSSHQLNPVSGWKGILKFGLRIIDQTESPDDFRFASISDRVRPKKEDITPPTPNDICMMRRRTLDIAFPVSRERVRRSTLVHDVRGISGFGEVSETQVVQGAINLMLSGELVPGDIHYCQLSGDFEKTLWRAIASRVELVSNTCKPADLHPSLVAHQIELDVRTTLKNMKALKLPNEFPLLQEIFLREGYVND